MIRRALGVLNRGTTVVTAAATMLKRQPLPGAETDDLRARLFEIIRTKSFGRGDIVLSSGKHSDFYFDMKPTMMDPEGANLIARLILPHLREARCVYVGGLEMGAIPALGAIVAHSYEQDAPVHGLFVRKKPKEHGARKQVEGLPKGETLAGKRVVIFDDVTTSGGSALVAVEACRTEGADVVLAISIVDRLDGAAETFAEAGIPFASLFTAAEFLSR